MACALQCIEIATTFYQRALPRELRDLVYLHVVRPKNGGTVRIGYLKAPPGFEAYEGDGEFDTHGESKDMQPSSWAMDPAFVGLEMAKEIAEVYRKKNPFFFSSLPDFVKAMADDHFRPRVRPLDHIRELSIAIDYRIEGLAGVYDALQTLGMIKNQDVLKVAILLNTDFPPIAPGYLRLDAECTMINLLEMLRCPVYELLHAGSKVVITHFDGDEGGYQEDTGSRDLTVYARF